MKHTKKVTIILLTLFLLTQFIGLKIISEYQVEQKKIVDGKEIINKTWSGLPYDIERPDFEQETSFIPMMIMVFLVTFFILLIFKFNLTWLWQFWFFLSVLFTLLIAFAPFMQEIKALVIAFILASLKLFRRNVITQNISELFIYGGLAAVFVPVLNMFSVSLFLIIISIYDYIAVFKTKHMVKLAKTHAKMKTFPGLVIPYGKKNKAAILGGGDLGIPLLFAGTALKTFGNIAYIIPLFTTAALYYLLTTGKKNKFYPAMPYLTVGCFLGLLILVIL